MFFQAPLQSSKLQNTEKMDYAQQKHPLDFNDFLSSFL